MQDSNFFCCTQKARRTTTNDQGKAACRMISNDRMSKVKLLASQVITVVYNNTILEFQLVYQDGTIPKS